MICSVPPKLASMGEEWELPMPSDFHNSLPVFLSQPAIPVVSPKGMTISVSPTISVHWA